MEKEEKIDLAIKEMQLKSKDANIRLQLLLHEIKILDEMLETLECVKRKK